MNATQWLKAPFRAALSWAPLRHRVIFELNQQYYADLGLEISLSHNLCCPFYFREAAHSFSEIFLQSEYSFAFDTIPLPERWIDLGCHAGYFSLWLAWLRRCRRLSWDFTALLIDGDSRMAPAVKGLIARNNLLKQMAFSEGVISAQDTGNQFIQRHSMASSLARPGSHQETGSPATRISPERILEIFPPPYGLIKVDIEGGEHHLATAYQALLRETEFLLMEWHANHPGGGGENQICDLIGGAGFKLLSAKPGEDQRHGILLFRR